MPTYENLKPCGVPGCRETAYWECECGMPHAEKCPKDADHYKFLCEEHMEQCDAGTLPLPLKPFEEVE